MNDVTGDLGDAAEENATAGRRRHVVQSGELSLGGLGIQRGDAADRQERAAVGDPGGRRRRTDLLTVDERAVRNRYQRHLGHPGQIGGVAVELGGTDPVRLGDDDADPAVEVAAEIVSKPIADLMCRRTRRQHPVVGITELDSQERRAEEEQQGDDRQADRNRTAHDEFR